MASIYSCCIENSRRFSIQVLDKNAAIANNIVVVTEPTKKDIISTNFLQKHNAKLSSEQRNTKPPHNTLNT